MSLGRIQKTTVLIVIALAALGAVGVMGTMMTSATTADAHPGPIHPLGCPTSDEGGVFVCPPAADPNQEIFEDGGKGIICTRGHCSLTPP